MKLNFKKNARASFEVNQVIRIKYLLLSRFHAFIVRAHVKDIKTGPTCPQAAITSHYIFQPIKRILWFPLEIITGVRKVMGPNGT